LKYTLKLIVFLIFTSFSYCQNLNPNSTGAFTFNPQFPLNRPSLRVFYHIPQGDMSVMPIVFSFHGAGRNGDDYRDFWIDMANQHGFMVFAPRFSSSNYPGFGDNYLMGNVFEDGDNPEQSEFNDPNEWTFSIIDPLFEYIKANVSGTQTFYNAWGHSGGAQFLHRFALFVPNSKLGVGVCSNAGWYTVPETGVDYPYGISLPFGPSNQNLFDFLQSPANDLNINLEQFFNKSLIIHLGTNDTDPNSSGLRHNTEVDNQQGLNRYVRGQYFFSTSQLEAQGLNTEFNWQRHDVSGASHQAQVMANDALQFILSSPLSSQNPSTLSALKFYPNPVNSNYVRFNPPFQSPGTVTVYDVLGAVVFKTLLKNQILDVSRLSAGIYSMKIESGNLSIIKKIIKQ
jgi:hypothetical protein